MYARILFAIVALALTGCAHTSVAAHEWVFTDQDELWGHKVIELPIQIQAVLRDRGAVRGDVRGAHFVGRYILVHNPEVFQHTHTGQPADVEVLLPTAGREVDHVLPTVTVVRQTLANCIPGTQKCSLSVRETVWFWDNARDPRKEQLREVPKDFGVYDTLSNDPDGKSF